MKDENKKIDFAYKGDWCEQTAEFAKLIGNTTIMERNYRRAIEAYEKGGYADQALRVARIIGDEKKIQELEKKLQ